jgi:hypothetical protein
MNLDDLLGQGATDLFEQALEISDKTTIFYSDWEYKAPEIITLDNINLSSDEIDHNPWPGPGVWKRATVVWQISTEQISTQEMYFQEEEGKILLVWGDGLCSENQMANTDSLKKLASPQMKIFLATYVDEMKVFLPNLVSFYGRFLLGGFEKRVINDEQVEIFATLKDPNSRMSELFNWRIAGSLPEEEPAWRTQVRQEIGLETLFPDG